VHGRREAILEAAGRLFRHYGPFKTTVADIAREARVGIGTVYLEFRSKDAILGALSRARHERVLVAVERAWGEPAPAPRRLERALTARVEAFLVLNTDGAHGADLFACSCPVVDEAYRDYARAERALFARFLCDGRDRGELRVEDPEASAHVLLLAYRAFEPPSLFAEEHDVLMRDLSHLHRLVLEGLLPRR
jgi:AcrR family transcriptional regulator